MGYSGHFIVANHPDPLTELPLFREIIHWNTGYEDEPGSVPSLGSRPGGWHLLELRYGLASGEDWLSDLVYATRAPIMIVSFWESELCVVRGFEPGPRATQWAIRLHPESAPTRYPNPKHRHLHGGLPPLWMISDELLGGAPAVDVLANWSGAVGGRPDRAALAAFVAEEPMRFARDDFFRLVDTLALSDQVEPAPYPHLLGSWDDPVKLEKSMAALQPGRYRALDCHQHGDCYALVRMRAEGDYVIEYREQKPEVLYQTVTPSLDVVVSAMTAWARGEVLWRDEFAWTEGTPPPR